MKNLKLFLILLLGASSVFAQDNLTQTIKGTVLDKEAEYPLIGVNVVLIGDEAKGSTTDIDGNFKIEGVPVGRQAIQFSYIGYETVTVPNILVNSAKEIVLNVEMEEDLEDLAEVVVTATKDRRKPVNEMATLSARSMTMEEVTRFSGATGDLARMAQNYAGVSGASDDRNDIIVRGNSPSTVLWRLEGVDIPSPNHWSTLGSSGGPISMLNTNSLRSSDFLSSAFPAEYGNATGAVFDLKLKNGNPDKFEFLGQLGFNGFEAGIEGPLKIGKNASFMANYRYSALGLFYALGLDFGTGSAVPQYQDLNFKINVPTKNAGRFSLWGLGGISDISFEASPDEDNLFNQNDENLNAGATTGIVGFSHLYFFDENTSSDFKVTLSSAESYANVEQIIEPNTDVFEKVFTSVNRQDRLGVNWTFNKKLNAKNRVKAGAIYDLYDINVQDSILINDSFWFTEVDFEGAVSLYRAFAQWQHKFNDRLTLNTGLHGAYLGLNDATSIEPRIGLSYEINDKSTVALAYGRHSQLQALPIYFSKNEDATEAENAANKELDFIKSDHFVASWDYLITPNTRVKVEGYYQVLNNLAVDPEDGDFSMVNFGADFGFPNRVGLTNDGKGSNVGMELTLERFLNKGFYYLLTASVFDSKYKGYDEEEHNTFFNSNYVFNVLAGKEFKLNDKFSITVDAKFNYAGGRRYTPIDLEASIAAGEEVRNMDEIYEAQYAPYIRPDLKIGYRQNSKKITQTFFIDFQNIIGRENEFFKSYDEDNQRIKTTYQRGFFPDVRYQILF